MLSLGRDIELYWDMDGVLVDLVGGMITGHRDFEGMNDWGMDFWANLPLTHLTKMILHDSLYSDILVPRLGNRVYILSSPCSARCCAGKWLWIEKYLGLEACHKLILTKCKSKLAGPNRILVDDYSNNLMEWFDEGGKIYDYKDSEEKADKILRSLTSILRH